MGGAFGGRFCAAVTSGEPAAARRMRISGVLGRRLSVQRSRGPIGRSGQVVEPVRLGVALATEHGRSTIVSGAPSKPLNAASPACSRATALAARRLIRNRTLGGSAVFPIGCHTGGHDGHEQGSHNPG